MRKETNMKDAWLSALGEAISERRLHINMTIQHRRPESQTTHGI
jgi:hypothetical protein